MLEELESRRPEFRPGLPLRMADGQVWSLPIPVEKDGEAGDRTAHWDDTNYRAILRAIAEAEDSGELFRAELALAVHWLQWNYALAEDDLDELLEDRDQGLARFILSEALRTLTSAHFGPDVYGVPVKTWHDPGTPITRTRRPIFSLAWRPLIGRSGLCS